MKKKFLLMTLLTLFCFFNSYSQDQTGIFSLGANMSYGSEKSLMGFGARAQYGFDEHIRGVAEYKYYLDRRDWSEWQINMDAHYLIEASYTVSLYPIVGLRFSRWTVDQSRSSGNSDNYYKKSTSRLGLNMGFGGQVLLTNNLYLQIEPKYELTKHYGQFTGTVGLMLEF